MPEESNHYIAVDIDHEFSAETYPTKKGKHHDIDLAVGPGKACEVSNAMRPLDRFEVEESAGIDFVARERPESRAGINEATRRIEGKVKREDPIQQGTTILGTLQDRCTP